MSRLEKMQPLPALQHAIQANHREIIAINERQLDEGETSEGADIGVYSRMWAEVKERYAPIDLKYTGSYREKMYLEIDNTATNIRSRDQKEQKLNQYVKKKSGGGTPLGIQKKNIPLMAAAVKPELVQQVKQQIGIR